MRFSALVIGLAAAQAMPIRSCSLLWHLCSDLWRRPGALSIRLPRTISRLATCFTVFTLAFASVAHAQSNEWAWMNGPQISQLPVYGTMGSPSAANFPGNRESAMTWTDVKGNLWLFGGDGSDSTGFSGYLNDLWEYAPSTNQWTWVGGSNDLNREPAAPGTYGTLRTPAKSNIPPGRSGGVTWIDGGGNLWLFGGYSFGAGNLNDVWEFNPSTGEWVWMGGSNTANQTGVYGTLGTPAAGNVPGARAGAAGWTDKKGNFWLFGGNLAPAAACLNDLWKLDLSTGQWTWMGGTPQDPSTVAVAGKYGTRGAAAATNIPGSRFGASAWADNSGNFWLSGGFGADSGGITGYLNDLWTFNPSLNQWTWMGGASTFPTSCAATVDCGVSGVYGVLQVSDPANVPGARQGAATWIDSRNDLWFFGGWGVDSNRNWGYFNDLWKYDPAANEWTWMGGDPTLTCSYTFCGQAGVSGSLKVPALGNVPGARKNAASWTDLQGNFWLFGGSGNNIVGVWGYFEDLWEYQPNTNASQVTAAPAFFPAPGSYTSIQSVTISDATPSAAIYYQIDGHLPAVLYTGPITLDRPETFEAIASAPGHANSDLSPGAYSVHVAAVAIPDFSPAPGTYPSAQTVTISDATPGATIFYTTDGTMPSASSSVYSGPVSVSASESIQAVSVASGLLNSGIASAVYTIGPDSTLGEWIWLGGSNRKNHAGIYGTLKTPAAGNMPGSRRGSASWTDSAGNLWLFGGGGFDVNGASGWLNDMWRFNPSTRQWAWMGGLSTINQPSIYGTLRSPAPDNTPGSRENAATWTDHGGRFWLFGGEGIDSTGHTGELDDLWEFDPSTNDWTWMGGRNYAVTTFFSNDGKPGVYGQLGVPSPSNLPGGRYSSITWVDRQGNFWLFGGAGQDGAGDDGTLNDLWEFNPSTDEWTWMGGANIMPVLNPFENGWYGTLGVPDPRNMPGGRSGAAGWLDNSGNLWLFGGDPGGSGDAYGRLNDLWRYDLSSAEWTWMGGGNGYYCAFDPIIGSNACASQPAVYGALGITGAANTPAGGSGFANWTDKNGNFWLFGGKTSDVTGQEGGFYQGQINELWVYNPSIGEWAWMGGDFATSNCAWTNFLPIEYVTCNGPQGVYNTVGAASVGSVPQARTSPVAWSDKGGNLWLFSGEVDPVNTGEVNDLWEYQPSLATLPAAATPIFSLEPGTYAGSVPINLSNGMAKAEIHYTTDGTAPTSASTVYSGTINLAASATLQAFATAPGYRDSAVASSAYAIVPAPATPVLSVPAGTYTAIQTVAISDATPGAAILYSTNAANPRANWLAYTGPVTIFSSETLTAVAAIPGTANTVFDGITVPPSGTLYSSFVSAAYVLNLPPAATPAFSLPAGTYDTAQTIAISDATPGAIIYYTTDGAAPTVSSTEYSGPVAVRFTETLKAIAVAAGYSASAVASATYTIPPDFSIAISPSSLAITAGQSGNASVSIASVNGFSSPVSFACSGLPAGATCAFNPASVTPNGTNGATTTLTISAGTSASNHAPPDNPFLPGATLAVAGCLLFWRKRRAMIWWVLALLISGSLLGLFACGGGSSGGGGGGGGTPPTNATVTVTASSGSLSRTATIALTITH